MVSDSLWPMRTGMFYRMFFACCYRGEDKDNKEGEMPYFPIFIDLKNKPVLIVGGGTVALRKLQKLLPYGGRLTVVAPHILPQLALIPGVNLQRHSFGVSDLRPRPALVIAATDDRETNHCISLLCKKRHIPVNAADDPALCSFLFPALVRQGDFSAGICTGGASPAAAAYFKERLRELLPEGLDGILNWLASIRPVLKTAIPEQHNRADIFRRLFDACMAKGGPLTREEAERYMDGELRDGVVTQGSAVPQGSVAACKSVAFKGSVALVGAGCGKADLITLRGLRLLQQCQAVVYDDLIDPALLESVPESALRLYMGKRSGTHAASQTQINQKLIELARSGLRVVRLKGGDPYLFGRGGEEMLALRAAGIPCQEVPGVPSAIGIAAEAGIPVTHRGVSRGVHIVTAHTADTPDGLPEDFDALAKLSGTLVFLMGLERLSAIVARLIAAGKDKNTPGAVISGGNAPNPVRVRAPLFQLEQAAKSAGVSPPAIILVGDVAAMDLSESVGPLGGRKIGVTGTREVAEKQLTAFRALGAEALWVLRLNVEELPMELDWRSMGERPGWIVFTSANGVRTFFERMEGESVDMSLLEKWKFAVIGAATGAALERYGMQADLCPETFTSEALAVEIAAAAKPGDRIMLLRSAMASSKLSEVLRGEGFAVEDLSIYDVKKEVYGDALPALDYLTFSSAGGVKLFFEQYGEIPAGTRCVCIGGVTAQALSQYVDKPFLLSRFISAEGVVETVLRDQREQGRSLQVCFSEDISLEDNNS